MLETWKESTLETLQWITQATPTMEDTRNTTMESMLWTLKGMIWETPEDNDIKDTKGHDV
jgi:hypothetical protein